MVGVSAGVSAYLVRLTGLPEDKVGVIFNPIVSDDIIEKARAPVDHPWFRDGSPVLRRSGPASPTEGLPVCFCRRSPVSEHGATGACS